MSLSRNYKETPVVSTMERLPNPSDGSTVLAREHHHPKWWPTRWSEVTRLKHAEWRKLEFTDECRQRLTDYSKRATAKRKAKTNGTR